MRHHTTARWIFWSNAAGFAITMPLWLLGYLSTRTLVGITLGLSWLAPMIEGWNGMRVTEVGNGESDPS